METKLFQAAAKGCITSLCQLISDDPLILDRILVNCFSETPLHVAAMLGHTDFVREIIRLKPELTSELSSQQSSPLHLASAKGHVDVVRALLSVDRRPCLARDRNGLTPLHLAAVKGRVEVMTMLLQAQPADAALLTVFGGENILHLCVKHYQLEALKLLVTALADPEFINSKDTDGNTVLHLAVANKQVGIIDFLLTVATLEVNAVNGEGMTAVDVLIRSQRDVRDSSIKESLTQAGGMEVMNQNMVSPSRRSNSIQKKSSKRDDWLDKKKNALMVVASLIATVCFQAGVDPPGGVYQEGKSAGTSILAHEQKGVYSSFYIANTIGFIASLSIILLLMSGLPIKRRFFMWILMVITWIAITTIALSYLFSLIGLAEPTVSYTNEPVIYVIGISVYVWAGLMALLLICHTIRLLVKLVKKLRMKLRERTVDRPVSLDNNVAP